MTDPSFKALFDYYEELLSREGLGIYRAAPGKKVRYIEPDEYEQLSTPPLPPRRSIHIPLDVLTDKEREVILCLFYDQLTERATAEQLEISRSSVRTYRDRALAKLKKALTRGAVKCERLKRLRVDQ